LQARSMVILMERRLMERKNGKKEDSNEAPS